MPADAEPSPCPICGKPSQPHLLPFCSRRCADIDLGRWLKGGYAIPGRPQEEAGDSPGPPSDSDEMPEK
jgi:endogenous inhibitor of DNA gyrase (YacG/DUF329 family)